MRWVADVLGHADPALTLRVYAHAMPAEHGDLAFADFASTNLGDAPGRPYTAPVSEETPQGRVPVPGDAADSEADTDISESAGCSCEIGT